MKNKLFLSALALSVLTPVVVQPIQVDAAINKPFKDVSKNNPYYALIHEMRDQNIISGYEDGTFRPSDVITRKHAAALVNRAKELPVKEAFVKFKDVSEKNPNFGDVKKLQQAGIFAPDSKGNFNPNKPVTRAEMAKILTIAFGLDVKATKDFPDVPASHEASKYVRAIYSNGITTGDNGLFKPNESLTRAHYAVFIHRAMILKTDDVSKPIEGPTDSNTTRPDEQTGLITDKYSHFLDIPLPPGSDYKSLKEKQEKKQAELRVREVHNYTGSFSISKSLSENNLTVNSEYFGITKEQLMSIINQAIETGEVYDGGHFSLYYSFDKGKVVISGRNN